MRPHLAAGLTVVNSWPRRLWYRYIPQGCQSQAWFFGWRGPATGVLLSPFSGGCTLFLTAATVCITRIRVKSFLLCHIGPQILFLRSAAQHQSGPVRHNICGPMWHNKKDFTLDLYSFFWTNKRKQRRWQDTRKMNKSGGKKQTFLQQKVWSHKKEIKSTIDICVVLELLILAVFCTLFLIHYSKWSLFFFAISSAFQWNGESLPQSIGENLQWWCWRSWNLQHLLWNCLRNHLQNLRSWTRRACLSNGNHDQMWRCQM